MKKLGRHATTPEIELAVARWFGPRRVVIVPNVSWGLGVHECDLLILSRAGYAYEVEIKTSRADLRADKRKRHRHNSVKLKWLWFALPAELEASIEVVPERAGVLIVDPNGRVRELRKPTGNPRARKLSNAEQLQLVRLATLRMWDLKAHVLRLRTQIQQLRAGAGKAGPAREM